MDKDTVYVHIDFYTLSNGIIRVIPPVASSAGEGGQPSGGEPLRVFPVYHFCPSKQGSPP